MTRIICVIFLLAMSGISYSAESLSALEKRINLNRFDLAIRSGSNKEFSALPALNYKNGLTGMLQKYKIYPNPSYSFVDCDETVKLTNGRPQPGCRISLKLAKKNRDGSYRDINIRVEYAIGLGEHKFTPNNSAYAQHAVDGNRIFESQLSD